MALNYTPKSCGTITRANVNSPRSSGKSELVAVLHGFGKSSQKIDSANPVHRYFVYGRCTPQ